MAAVVYRLAPSSAGRSVEGLDDESAMEATMDCILSVLDILHLMPSVSSGMERAISAGARSPNGVG